MFRRRDLPGPTALLASAALGVYLLVIAGATADLADAAQACSSWPACDGAAWSPSLAVAVGHRVMAAAVGILVLLAGIVVLRSGAPRRVTAACGLAVGLYPVQLALGALVATSGPGTPFPGAHLLVGTSIFGALVLSLAWHLERETGQETGSPVADPETVASPVDGAEGAPAATREPADPQTAPVGGDRTLVERVRGRIFAYFRLMKPRLMWLLCLVAAAGMALAAGPDLSVGTIVLCLGGGVLAIGASGTFNHVLERDRDQKMSRTADRPIATHTVGPRRATAFGLVLTALSLAVFWQLNALAAALGLSAILFYSVVYTLVLKPNTVQNTVVGGAAGALPALIGSAAVTGRIGLPGLVLAGVIFVWTPAHFYNLALAYKDDYARGGFPMMPVVRGESTTRKHVLLWLGTTLAAAGGLIWLTELGWLSAITTVGLGGLFLWAVVRLHRERTEQAAFRAFHASNAYLGLFLVAIVVDALAV